MSIDFELILRDVEHVIGRFVSPTDAWEILSALEMREWGQLDLGAVLRDDVGPVLYAALERWFRLSISNPVRNVEFDRDRAVLNRFGCGLASRTALGAATVLAASLCPPGWATAIAISGVLEGHHFGGMLGSVGSVGRKVLDAT